MDPLQAFAAEVKDNIGRLRAADDIQDRSRQWIRDTAPYRYTYNFTWLGRPIIQFPQDIVAVQELIWSTRPDVIVETGVAHGGSLILSASILQLLGGTGRVVGIDIDIREHIRREIEAHPLFSRIELIEGSSVDPATVDDVRDHIAPGDRVMVMLDSNHSHDHVRRELDAYSPLVTAGCYLVVFDTVIEDMPAGSFPDRPWDKGDNPRTAVLEFVEQTDRFEIDADLVSKLQITTAPDGYLRCTKD
jgi:cephalosporin hydroxylase